MILSKHSLQPDIKARRGANRGQTQGSAPTRAGLEPAPTANAMIL